MHKNGFLMNTLLLVCVFLLSVFFSCPVVVSTKEMLSGGGVLTIQKGNPVNDACEQGILSIAQSLNSTDQSLCFASAVVAYALLSGKWDPYLFRNVNWITAEQLGDIVIQPHGRPAALLVSFGHMEDGTDGIIHSFVFERNLFDPKNNEMQYRIWMSWLAKYYLLGWYKGNTPVFTPYSGGAILSTRDIHDFFKYLTLLAQHSYPTNDTGTYAWGQAFGIKAPAIPSVRLIHQPEEDNSNTPYYRFGVKSYYIYTAPTPEKFESGCTDNFNFGNKIANACRGPSVTCPLCECGN